MTESDSLLRRLSIAGGQIQGLIRKLTSDAPAVEVAQQLQAVEKAMTSIKAEYVMAQMELMLEARPKEALGQKRRIASLKELAKYLHR